MASQVLSGTSNPSYTNNTGQNSRLIIYYMQSSNNTITMNWGNPENLASISDNGILAIGKDLCFYVGAERTAPDAMTSKNMARSPGGFRSAGGVFIDTTGNMALPIEIMLAPNQIFNATCNSYNILVITES
jgi:hypothetical protein